MKLIIKGEMTGLNEYVSAERSSRYAAAEIKQTETHRVKIACKEQKLEPTLTKHDYTFTWYVPNLKKDPDNISFAVKFIFDGLKEAGVIPNDGMKHVGNISHIFIHDPYKQQCVVDIL